MIHQLLAHIFFVFKAGGSRMSGEILSVQGQSHDLILSEIVKHEHYGLHTISCVWYF